MKSIQRQSLSAYDLIWTPEGRKIATVVARDASAAIRKAPKPYRKYLGEIYADRAVKE